MIMVLLLRLFFLLSPSFCMLFGGLYLNVMRDCHLRFPSVLQGANNLYKMVNDGWRPTLEAFDQIGYWYN